MISFVIPAWNEEVLIGRTIRSLQAAVETLDHPCEIVVADDASDDRTAAIATTLGVRVVHCNNRQIAATRNAGARAAVGDRLVFVDADTVVPPEVVRETLAAFDSGAAAGTSFPLFDGRLPLYGRLLLPPLRIAFRTLRLASGAYVFCTRSAFERVGGFDEAYFAGEEAIFARRLRKEGPFCTIASRVITSGRKVRTHTGREILGAFISLARPGRSAVRHRHDIWYAPRRVDPDASGQIQSKGPSE